MIVAVDEVAAATVSMENVCVVLPAATVTLAGTMATALLLARVTAAPDAGAAADKVTVPVTARPPAIREIDSETESSVAVAVDGEVVDEDDPLHAHQHKEAVRAPYAASLAILCRSGNIIESDDRPLDPRVVKRRWQNGEKIVAAAMTAPLATKVDSGSPRSRA